MQNIASSLKPEDTTMPFATTPSPPYYAVIFTNKLNAEGAQRLAENGADYAAMADHMVTLAQQQPGYLGIESVRDAQGVGITVSYWNSLAAITAWRANAEHRIAQDAGKAQWYDHYETRIAKVERAYPGPGGR